MSARERAHIDQASQEAVRLLIILLLLILAIYDIKVMIADCCFPCTCRMLPRRFYSPSCRQGVFPETCSPPVHWVGGSRTRASATSTQYFSDQKVPYTLLPPANALYRASSMIAPKVATRIDQML